MYGWKYGQFDTFTLSGYWTLPASPAALPGELRYEDGRIRLQLVPGPSETAFDVCERLGSNLPVRAAVHGTLMDSTPCTLYGVHWVHVGEWAHFDVDALAVGGHLADFDSQLVDGFDVEIPGLPEWFRDDVFKRDFPDGRDQLRVAYVEPEEFTWPLQSPLKSIRRYSVESAHFRRTSATLSYTTLLRTLFESPRTLGWAMSQVGQLERFFSLIIAGEPVQTARVRIGTKDVTVEYFHTRWQLPSSPDHFNDGIRYEALAPDMGQLLAAWCAMSPDMQLGWHLWDKADAAWERSPRSLRFIQLMQALEVIARGIVTDVIAPPDEFAAAFARIRCAMRKGTLREPLRQSILSRANWANEPSLVDRILQLLQPLDDASTSLFCVDRDRFVRGLVDTRNYHTHYSKSRYAPLEGEELMWAVDKLRLMLRAVTLHNLGLPVTRIPDVLSRTLIVFQQRSWAEVAERGRKLHW